MALNPVFHYLLGLTLHVIATIPFLYQPHHSKNGSANMRRVATLLIPGPTSFTIPTTTHIIAINTTTNTISTITAPRKLHLAEAPSDEPATGRI